MENSRDLPLLPALSDVLARQIGLHFPPERWPELLRGLQGMARELHFSTLPDYFAQLLSQPLTRQQIEILARHLTIGETYFFREPQVFEALQCHVLPALIEERRQSTRQLRLWSAGCSTGEEAYSLAILLHRMIPDIAEWNITVLGTDINPQALEKAAAGIYGEWSFRGAPPWLRERYFRHAGKNLYEIIPAVRNMVMFAYLNLADDTYPSPAGNTGAMDIVFCRNVLMYFEPEMAARVVEKHYRALVKNGWLAVSPSEISQTSFARFVPAYLPGAILHQKSSPPPKPEQPAVTISAKVVEAIRPKLPKTIRPTAVATAQKIDVAALLLTARTHANRGELPAAQELCQRAVATDRLNPLGHYLLGAILQELGRSAEAALAHKRTLYLDPEFVLAHFALGNIYRDQHQPHVAAKHFDNALLILEKQREDDLLPESDGLTSGRLMEIIRSGTRKEDKAA
ncbi:MAG: CheR family methyltransferase [Methylocystis sp.]|uniref:CheR family methyltransferase n=1 Tax=Methylocystis sp. TaxID=1911079 RepID=UPI003DA6343E